MKIIASGNDKIRKLAADLQQRLHYFACSAASASNFVINFHKQDHTTEYQNTQYMYYAAMQWLNQEEHVADAELADTAWGWLSTATKRKLKELFGDNIRILKVQFDDEWEPSYLVGEAIEVLEAVRCQIVERRYFVDVTSEVTSARFQHTDRVEQAWQQDIDRGVATSLLGTSDF